MASWLNMRAKIKVNNSKLYKKIVIELFRDFIKLIKKKYFSLGIGYLFASKAAVQIIVNPFSGAVIDRIGQNPRWKLGQQTPPVGTILAYRIVASSNAHY